MPDRPVLDLFTVAYARDLPGLALQARSLDRFFAPADLGRIVVAVNDIAEDRVAAEVEALRPAWGRFAPRLEVVRPAALFALRPPACRARSPRRALTQLYTAHRALWPWGRKGGWRGNRGWSVQQAIKLAAARLDGGSHLLVLDAKNHFIRPVGAGAFVAADGRALSRMARPNDEHWSWIVASFRRLGVDPPHREAPAPQSITPFVAPRAHLRACVDGLEAELGPLEAFFARKKTRETEFMLVYAWTVRALGAWEAAFAPGLCPPATIFGRDTAEEVDAVLARAEAGAADVLSAHSGRTATLEAGQRRRLEALWAAHGLAP